MPSTMVKTAKLEVSFAIPNGIAGILAVMCSTSLHLRINSDSCVFV